MSSQGRVLVVDDVAKNVKLLADTLAVKGYEVATATSGAEAIAHVESWKPDLVLLDVVMPDIGGIDAAREMVNFDPDARILMCSALGQQALMAKATEAGAREFVVKPFQPSRVLEAVQRVLE